MALSKPSNQAGIIRTLTPEKYAQRPYYSVLPYYSGHQGATVHARRHRNLSKIQ